MPINTEYILCYSKAESFEKNIQKKDTNYKYKDSNFEKYGSFNTQPLCRASLTWYKNLDFIIYIKKENGKLVICFQDDDHVIGKIVAGPSKLSIEEKLELRQQRLNGIHNENDWRFYWSKDVIKSAFEVGFIHITEENGEFKIYQKDYLSAKYSGRNKRIEIIDRSKMALRNVISDTKITTKTGNDEIISIFNEKIFDYPKPTLLIKKFLSVKKQDVLVLDFFSGSATTAHAVMDLNVEDEGNRNFIMIQIPEKIEYKNFETICEIGKERIRRVSEAILKQNKRTYQYLSNLDVGFRVLKLDTSNIKEFEFGEKSNQSSLFENNILEDRKPLDLLFETIIKLGFTLDKEIKEYKFNGNKIYSFDKGVLMACFDKNITIETIKEIIKTKEELNPLTWKVIFLDSGFDSDQTKINARELIRSSLQKDNEKDINKVFNTI